ncbi:MAG TPA: glycoside hydrolase family 36 protein, partial [Armatimonadota bacterium]
MNTASLLLALLAVAVSTIAIPVDAAQDKIRSTGDMVTPTAAENQAMQDWTARSFLADGQESKDLSSDFFVKSGIPFSFTYGGVHSSKLLQTWDRTSKSREFDNRTETQVSWADPKTGLKVTAIVKSYKNYPASDWVLNFENQGKQDTPIIEDIQALDTLITTDTNIGMLHHLLGDDTGIVGQDTFAPRDWPIYPGRSAHLAPDAGRPSSGDGFPFFNFEYENQGVIVAIGWSGQWAATIDHTAEGPTRMRAGMELTHLLLHPGEKIRSPRIVMLHWTGDRMKSHNQFRRLMIEHYSPKPGGKPVSLPIALQTFDRYRNRPGWGTEAGQLEGIDAAHELGCDTYWLDATWYAGGFPNGAGNWFVDTKAFPNGLKPLSDACHKYGMRFVLWFDPERVIAGTQIDVEHPDWVMRSPNDRGVFDLGNPAARRWLTDLLSKRIDEFGLDIYRHDSNIAPLKYWRAKDTADRQGISEIRHVEGLYEMWDELLAKHPNLLIDNCQSGGRRIDIETCSLAVPLWRSDSGCWDAPEGWNQMQSLALSLYVPLNTTGLQSPESYKFRSGATGGAICEFGHLDSDFSKETAKGAIAEARANAKYWSGDIYPLTHTNIALDHFMAFQLYRADLDEGMVLAFRREECPTRGLMTPLHGIHPDRKYSVEFIYDSRKVTKKIFSG